MSTLFGINGYLLSSAIYGNENKDHNINTDVSQGSARPFIEQANEINLYPIRDWSSIGASLGAKAGAVYDLNSSKYLYIKNSDIQLPIASLTKLMTAVVVTENLNMDEKITISGTAIAKSKLSDGGSQLSAGETLTIRQILKILLIESSNDAAYMFEEVLSKKGISLVDSMNKKAESLKMLNTFFTDPSGLEDLNSYSTVDNLVKLTKYALNVSDITEISSKGSDSFSSLGGTVSHNLESTNKLFGEVSGIVLGKTGYTAKALGCMILAKAVDSDDKIIVVVLGSQDRFAEVKSLVDWSLGAYKWEGE